MNKKHPLDETFDMDSEFVETPVKIDLPENPTLEDIVRLSLEAYKMQLEGAELMEPKFRSRAFEVAQQFLNTAKDAISKKTELDQKQQKLENELGKGDKEKKSTSRNAILYEINQAKKNEAV